MKSAPEEWVDCTCIFSNGTEFELFVETQCGNCTRYRNDHCRVLNRCYKAIFDASEFPYDDLLDHVKYGGKRCKHKTTEKPAVKRHKKQITGQMSLFG